MSVPGLRCISGQPTPKRLSTRSVRYIDGVASGKDPLKLGIHLTVYVALFYATAFVFSGLLEIGRAHV